MLDYGNDVVMKWIKGSKEGSFVVGGNRRGQKLNKFDSLEGLSLDR